MPVEETTVVQSNTRNIPCLVVKTMEWLPSIKKNSNTSAVTLSPLTHDIGIMLISTGVQLLISLYFLIDRDNIRIRKLIFTNLVKKSLVLCGRQCFFFLLILSSKLDESSLHSHIVFRRDSF